MSREEVWHQLEQMVLEVKELLRAGGDKQAEGERLMDVLFHRLGPHVARWVSWKVPPYLREDAIQEALQALYLGLDTYDPAKGTLESWAFTVTIHAAYRLLKHEYRKNRGEILVPNGDPHQEEEADWLEQVADPDEPLDMNTDLRLRLQAIFSIASQVLNVDELQTWQAWVQDIPYEEIATLLNIRVDLARQLVRRARQKVAAGVMLNTTILDRAQIEFALKRCMASDDPLTPEELAIFRQCVLNSPERMPPPYRQIERFREACVKVLRYITNP